VIERAKRESRMRGAAMTRDEKTTLALQLAGGISIGAFWMMLLVGLEHDDPQDVDAAMWFFHIGLGSLLVSLLRPAEGKTGKL
jgi:hypothetical protein